MSLDARCVDQEVALFIGGTYVSSASEATLEVINPSNGRLCLSIPAGCESDADRAVSSARAAFEDGRWSEAPPSHKSRTLHHLADLIASQNDVFDALDAGEMGKPVREAFGNAAAAARLMRFYAEAVDKLMGDVYSSDKTSFVAQRRMPRGVVAAVLPWNFPTLNAVIKVAPALASGNCVVVKPSELSSRSAMLLAELAIKAGVPPGVLNVVPGQGEIIGQALGLHRDVDMVTFTGSTDVGRRMLQYAGQSNMKVVLAECGGKSPQIVFDDGIDVNSTADSIARLMLTNQGQICSVGSRLLVQRSLERKLLDRIADRFGEVAMGDALDPATTFGPIASAKQYRRVTQYIQGAAEEGAQLVIGGRRVLEETQGYFVEPTIFRNVSPHARLAQEEIFGPVLAVIPFDDEAEAIRIANGTKYGLAAYVWTARITTGMRMARGIRSSLRVNAIAPMGEGAGFAASHEPVGLSGVGIEGGLAGMESYLRRQRIWISHG